MQTQELREHRQARDVTDVPTLSVVVPWHNTHPTRAQSWHWMRRWYEQNMPFAEIIQVQPDEGEEFNKPSLVNKGVQRASGEVVIIADSDVLPAVPDVLPAAASHALYAPWVVPHGQVLRLRDEVTVKLLGEPVTTKVFPYGPLVRHPYMGVAGGGMLVIRRERFLAMGGFDPVFKGWGGEDTAFGIAADTLLGQHLRYAHVPLLHFYHPPGPRAVHVEYARNSKRVELYRVLAAHGKEALAQQLGVSVPSRDGWLMTRPERDDSIYEWLLYLNYLGVKVRSSQIGQKRLLMNMAVSAEYRQPQVREM